jgi:transposase InsO family protein
VESLSRFAWNQCPVWSGIRTETINGLYKAELIHRRAPWKTKEAVEFATLEWVAWFNHHRLLEPIGYIPPAEAEANYYRQLASQNTEVVA